jgi:hypothetical protein
MLQNLEYLNGGGAGYRVYADCGRLFLCILRVSAYLRSAFNKREQLACLTGSLSTTIFFSKLLLPVTNLKKIKM